MIKLQFLTDFDIHLFAEGSHYRLYDKMGAHLTDVLRGEMASHG